MPAAPPVPWPQLRGHALALAITAGACRLTAWAWHPSATGATTTAVRRRRHTAHTPAAATAWGATNRPRPWAAPDGAAGGAAGAARPRPRQGTAESCARASGPPDAAAERDSTRGMLRIASERVRDTAFAATTRCDRPTVPPRGVAGRAACQSLESRHSARTAARGRITGALSCVTDQPAELAGPLGRAFLARSGRSGRLRSGGQTPHRGQTSRGGQRFQSSHGGQRFRCDRSGHA